MKVLMRRCWIGVFFFILLNKSSFGQVQAAVRQEWLTYLDRVAGPVLRNLAQDQLRQRMPVALSPTIDNREERSKVAYLEAFGRTLCGIAPWLNLEGGNVQEVTLRDQYRQWALQAIGHAVNPKSADYLLWKGSQPLVDASFFALALIRAPWLWEHLAAPVKEQVKQALLQTRETMPGYNNWILFPAMIETFFCQYGMPYDRLRIEYAIREFAEHWYVGDGLFADGPSFHMDYYDSYVIQPYLQTILAVMGEKEGAYKEFTERFEKISRRYAAIQERLINTDGSYPITGRSIVYRGGTFHHLANMALTKRLPENLAPPQVRAALTAVLKKTSESPTTFSSEGWLLIGVYGEQKNLADSYITTGSLYLCSTLLLPLGLPETDPFWQGPDQPWTALKVWKGMDAAADHALDAQTY